MSVNSILQPGVKSHQHVSAADKHDSCITAKGSLLWTVQCRVDVTSSTQNSKHGKALLGVIMQLLGEMVAPAVVQRALSCLLAMVAITPMDSRAAFVPVITSGEI